MMRRPIQGGRQARGKAESQPFCAKRLANYGWVLREPSRYEADPLKTLHEPCDREVIRAFILGTTRREQTCRGGRVWVPEICHRRTSCRQRLP